MIGRVVNGLLAVVAYLCVATVVAQLIGLFYLYSWGTLTRDNLVKVLALAEGIDLDADRGADAGPRPEGGATQVSLADVARERALAVRDFELREQSLEALRKQLDYERAKILDEQGSLKQLAADFEKRLKELREGTLVTRREEARLILESAKPKQAKEQLALMIQAGEMDEAVALFASMPQSKQAKIMAEFRTPDEADQLAEMLRIIRRGQPEVPLVDETKKQVTPEGS